MEDDADAITAGRDPDPSSSRAEDSAVLAAVPLVEVPSVAAETSVEAVHPAEEAPVGAGNEKPRVYLSAFFVEPS